MRITANDVRGIFKTFASKLPTVEGYQWFLSEWSPGDRYGTRYSVELRADDTGAVHTGIFGDQCWTGREAWEVMRACIAFDGAPRACARIEEQERAIKARKAS